MKRLWPAAISHFFFSDIDDDPGADPGSVSGSVSLGGFPPVEERSRPDGAEEEAPDTNRTSGDDGDDEEVLNKKKYFQFKKIYI